MKVGLSQIPAGGSRLDRENEVSFGLDAGLLQGIPVALRSPHQIQDRLAFGSNLANFDSLSTLLMTEQRSIFYLVSSNRINSGDGGW